MISKSEIKLIASLNQKKNRQKHGLFVAEGVKLVSDLLTSGYIAQKLFVTKNFTPLFPEGEIINDNELQKISFLKNPSGVVGIFKINTHDEAPSKNEFIIALDAIRDPGNLGTVIRLADWFGVNTIVCSLDTVDVYNPKVVQATMGSIARVNVYYLELVDYLKTVSLPIYTTTMQGKSVYKITLKNPAVLVMGNEGNGISQPILSLADNALSIPSFRVGAESLNVSTATAIFLSEFMRFTER